MTNAELIEALMDRGQARDDLYHAYEYDMWFHTAVDRAMMSTDEAVVDVLLTALAKQGEDLAEARRKLVECEKRRISPSNLPGAF